MTLPRPAPHPGLRIASRLPEFATKFTRRARRRLTRLRKAQEGGVAIEFALVAPAFIALVLGILHIALIYLAQQGLESAVENASRLVMTGSIQSLTVSGQTSPGLTKASDFKSAVCNGISGKSADTDANGNPIAVSYAGSLPPFLSCDRLTVNVQVVPTGCASPTITAPTLTYDSKSGTLTGSSAGYGTISCDGKTNDGTGIGSTQGKLVIMQLAYLWPTVAGPLGLNFTNPSYGNNRMILATYTFTVEQYLCPVDSTGATKTC
ncbi:TadE/TadG family type IV pilus assembly protein [Novosphingobium rosa]|uniref:TadE/TadG family type IV pilus assembly protein n=1 Tax=Novosphingobium rosa TaxID=76978 RepID=UPI0012EE1B32|nr:TadE/TadG family type IV pilus assembly protein [Novosphingobium rosa]